MIKSHLNRFSSLTVSLCIVLLAVIVITGSVAMRRAKKGSSDWDTFYKAGHSVRAHQGIYYSGDYYQEAGDISPFLYSPIAALFFAPFAVFSIEISAFLWNLVNIILFLISFHLMLKLMGISPGDFFLFLRSFPRMLKIVFIVLLLSMCLDNLSMAQVNILVFVLCLWGLQLWKMGKNWSGGLVLAFSILLKLTPFIFLFYFILKRSWKMVAGIFAGLFLFTVVVPTLVFGINLNRLYHRQWLGRTLKPTLIQLRALFPEELPHPLKKTIEDFRYAQLEGRLGEKNQSLEAAVTRLLLRNRNSYDQSEHPIYAVRRYKKLPVLFGGLSENAVNLLIKTMILSILLVLTFCLLPGANAAPIPVEAALLFLSMTLLAPWSRSHQSVSWLFFLFVIIQHWKTVAGSAVKSHTQILKPGLMAASLLYFLQGMPYGKAAGLGAWSNLIFWILAVSITMQYKCKPKLGTAFL